MIILKKIQNNSYFKKFSSSKKGDYPTAKILILLFIILVSIIYSRLVYAPCDDAYIFYVYAKNFVQGNGLTYNGTVVQGYTSILWVTLLSFAGLSGVPIHILGEILSTISGCAALLAVYHLARSCSLSRWQSLIPVGLVAVTGDFVFYMSVGLEQTLFVALIAWSTSYIIRSTQPNIFHILLISFLMATMLLTRPEGALIIACLLGVWAFRLQSLRAPFYSGILVAVIIIPVLIIIKNYYGYWLPNTYYVKSNTGFANLYHGVEYIAKSVIRYGLLAGVGITLSFWYLRKNGFRNINVSSILFGISLLWLSYVTIQGGDNMVGGRMIIPVIPLLYIGLLMLAIPLLGKKVVLASVLLGIGIIISYMSDHWVRDQSAQWRSAYEIRRKAGIYLHDNYPPNTKVALSPAGTIPYYSELPTIDMLGLNNEYIAHYGKKDTKLRFGHQAGDGEYVLSQHPDIILFRGTPSLTPTINISDQEIWHSPQFHEEYFPVYWENIGIAYLRKNSESSKILGRCDL